ncbi:hypothetical protein AABC73_03530 [Pseudomonas sp. G.S.17]|uniref:hypothetical protein n=1 Tax=Pseudomonas sp. G.S.17 TaxID=3137451 RepID=UPI00311C9CCE
MSDDSSRSLLRGSNLVSFFPELSPLSRGDILDALLWAQLSASDRYNPEKQWEQWIELYTAVLIDSSFKPGSSLAQKPVKVSNESDFRREATKLVKTINPPGLANVAEVALNDMFNSAHARLFFDSWFNFNAGRSDSFQIVPCEKGGFNQVKIAACGLQMVTRTKVKPPNGFFPAWPFTYEMTLTLRGGGFVYDVNDYATHRERIREALRAKGSEAIGLIQL